MSKIGFIGQLRARGSSIDRVVFPDFFVCPSNETVTCCLAAGETASKRRSSVQSVAVAFSVEGGVRRWLMRQTAVVADQTRLAHDWKARLLWKRSGGRNRKAIGGHPIMMMMMMM